MNFPYRMYIVSSSDTGELVPMLRPEINVRIYGPAGDADALALVDTGSDKSIFPMSFASDVGITTTPGTGLGALTFGGHGMPLEYADVELEIPEFDPPLRWRTRLYFADISEETEQAILGHNGFLDYFTATFDGEECSLELVPNSDLPLVELTPQ